MISFNTVIVVCLYFSLRPPASDVTLDSTVTSPRPNTIYVCEITRPLRTVCAVRNYYAQVDAVTNIEVLVDSTIVPESLQVRHYANILCRPGVDKWSELYSRTAEETSPPHVVPAPEKEYTYLYESANSPTNAGHIQLLD